MGLGSEDHTSVLPLRVQETTVSLRRFIVEDVRSARRFLRILDAGFPIDESEFLVLNKHSVDSDIDEMLLWLKQGYDAGLMSEAGLPGVADPGAELVFRAHEMGFRIIPLSGPSSIFLALMSSGLNGQNFAFNGYLPIQKAERISEIKKLEKLARNGQSQIFMETPYRNMKMLDDLSATLGDDIYLCIASNITLPDEAIHTRAVAEWKRKGFPGINKKPSIFIIGCRSV